EVQSVHTAVNVNQITIAEVQITTQNFAKIFFGQWWKCSNATALALPLCVTERGERAIRKDSLRNLSKFHVWVQGSRSFAAASTVRVSGWVKGLSYPTADAGGTDLYARRFQPIFIIVAPQE